MKLRKIVTLATAGTAAVSISLFGLGLPAAHADSTQPVTFQVENNGSLVLYQDNSLGTTLLDGSAVNLPVTTVTDNRNSFARSGAWSVSASASPLLATEVIATVTTIVATIVGNQITLDETLGSFTSGTGSRVGQSPVVGGPAALVSATGNSIDSVFTYTPTALLAAPHSVAGLYLGTISQTVV